MFKGIATAAVFASVLAASDYHVATMTQLVPAPLGGRVAWSPGPNNLIAYDSQDQSTGFYQVWTMKPDGTSQTCLTCAWEPPGGAQPHYHKGNPDWHPLGNYLVIQVQRSDTTYGRNGDSFSKPGLGQNNILYIADAAGLHFWPVPGSANYTPHNGGLLHPHFSHTGDRLTWAQETRDGMWEIRVASFTVVNNVPIVGNPVSYDPVPSQCPYLGAAPFYETHGFSRDDSTLFFSANPQTSCGSVLGYDIYSYNLTSGSTANLTNTPDRWDEHSRPSPVQDKLLYVSSYGLNATSSNLLQEYWSMNYDGSDKKKLTWITDSRGPYFMPGATSVGDNDWNHDGTQSVIYLIGGTGGSTSTGQTGSIWLMTLEPSSTTVSPATYLGYSQAQDGLVSSFGTGLSNGEYAASTLPVPTNLGGTTVRVTDAKGATRDAQVLYASKANDLVNWAIPSGTAAGPAVVTTKSGDGNVLADIFDVEAVSPGIFTINASGIGPPAAYVLVYPTGTSTPAVQNTFDCSAGSYKCVAAPVSASSAAAAAILVLYVTGVRHSSAVFVTIDGQSLTPAFSGAQADVGLDQINVQLPMSLTGAGLVNATVTADGSVSNTVQIKIQ